MKKKVGISISEGVYKKVKVYCAKKDFTISEIFEYAVEVYIDRMESIKKEMESRELGDFIEDNYIEILKQSVKANEIGPKE